MKPAVDTSDDLHGDIAFVRDIASSAAASPLVHGPDFLLWGVLVAAAHFASGAIEQQVLPLPYWTISAVWLATMMAGWSGSYALSKLRPISRGESSLANRTIQNIWSAGGLGVSVVSVSAMIGVLSGNLDPKHMDMLTTMTLVIYAVGFSAGGYAARTTILQPFILLTYAGTFALVWLIDTHQFSLAAGATALIVVATPGVIMMAVQAQEKKAQHA